MSPDLLQHRTFINPQPDIRLAVRLTAHQGKAVQNALKSRYAGLCELCAAGKAQVIHSAGMLRIAGVRGGVLPASPTADEVQAVVEEVKAAAPDPAHWAAKVEYQVAHSRAVRRTK